MSMCCNCEATVVIEKRTMQGHNSIFERSYSEIGLLPNVTGV
jgi:hypothetical protein